MDMPPPLQPVFNPPALVAKFDPSPKAEAAPTPHEEITRVISLLPKPSIGFVDFGCGADARWCIAAAEKWGCKVTGVEIDPLRAKAAKERVRIAGLSKLVTIIEGDAITTEVQADVGVAYLYADVLEKMKPKFEKLAAFASYLHQPPGLPVSKNGDTDFYTQPVPVAAASWPTSAVWGNRTYTGPVCNSPNCAMCQSIVRQLSTPVVQTQSAPASSGYYVKRCSNGVCWYEYVPAK